jgi:hypothetical protein
MEFSETAHTENVMKAAVTARVMNRRIFFPTGGIGGWTRGRDESGSAEDSWVPRRGVPPGGGCSFRTGDPIRIPAPGMASEKGCQRTRNRNEQNDKCESRTGNLVAGHVQ